MVGIRVIRACLLMPLLIINTGNLKREGGEVTGLHQTVRNHSPKRGVGSRDRAFPATMSVLYQFQLSMGARQWIGTTLPTTMQRPRSLTICAPSDPDTNACTSP